MTITEDRQIAFEEKAIEDPDLEDLLWERILSAPAAARYAATSRKIKKHLADRGYVDDVRYRCGEYVFRLETKGRDGYEVEGSDIRRFAELTSDSERTIEE